MKSKTLFSALAILNLALVAAEAQVTVTTVTTDGLSEPYNVVEDADFNVYVTDSVNNRIVRIDVSTQVHTTLAGIAEDAPGSDDGPAYLAHFSNPQGLLSVSGVVNNVATNGSPNPVVGDLSTNVVVTTNGLVVTTNVIVTDTLNGLVVADTDNSLIRCV